MSLTIFLKGIITTGNYRDVLGDGATVYSRYLAECSLFNTFQELGKSRLGYRQLRERLLRKAGIQLYRGRKGYVFRGALFKDAPDAQFAKLLTYTTLSNGADPFNTWVASHVRIHPDVQQPLALSFIYAEYFQFCCATRQKAMGKATFSKRLEAMGALRMAPRPDTRAVLYNNLQQQHSNNEGDSNDNT